MWIVCLDKINDLLEKSDILVEYKYNIICGRHFFKNVVKFIKKNLKKKIESLWKIAIVLK